MARRQRVPTALRDELTEYSSLLRALRTTQTLDVTAHLTRSPEPIDHKSGAPEPEESTATASTSTGAGTRKRKRSQSEPGSPNWRNRDQWTRWPLPLKDVPPPDWGLQDEIQAVVKQALLASIEPDSDSEDVVKHEEGVEADHDSSSDDEDAYMQHLAEVITPVVETRLESLFALICAHTVARSDGMQNRIEPFDWHDLVNILCSPMAAHLVDETILRNLITTMEALYEPTPTSTSTALPPPTSTSTALPPPSPTTGASRLQPYHMSANPQIWLALHRQSLVHASRSRLNNLLSEHTASLFEQSLPSPNDRYLTVNQLTRKKKKQKEEKVPRTVNDQVEENTEDTHQDTRPRPGKKKRRTQNSGQSNDDSEWDASRS